MDYLQKKTPEHDSNSGSADYIPYEGIRMLRTSMNLDHCSLPPPSNS